MNTYPRRAIRIVGAGAVPDVPSDPLEAEILDQATLLCHLVRELAQAQPSRGVHAADTTAMALLQLAREFGRPSPDAA